MGTPKYAGFAKIRGTFGIFLGGCFTLEAQLPIYWVPVLKSLYTFVLSIAQGPTIWVPGLLGSGKK